MAFKLAANTAEWTTTQGAGTMTTQGQPTGMMPFSLGIGTGNTTMYHVKSGDGVSWETGIGTVTVSAGVTTIARTTVLDSFNGTTFGTSAIALVGTSIVFCSASLSHTTDANGLFDQFFGATNGNIIQRVAGVWVGIRRNYTVGFSHPSTAVFTASEVCGHHRMPVAVTFPANFGSTNGYVSEAGGSAVTTGSTVFNVDKAASATPNTFSNIGTITFAAGTVTPTFATSGGAAVNFAQGDVMRLVAPASADATFAGVYATLCSAET